MKNDNETISRTSKTLENYSGDETTIDNAEVSMTDDEIIDTVAKRILNEYRKAFEKLAK